MLSKNYTQVIRPMNGPMDLNAGRPSAKDAALNGGFTLGASLVMAIGALIFTQSLPSTNFDGSYNWRALNIIGMVLGVFVVFFSARYAWSMGNITIKLWEHYLVRLKHWHDAELEAYIAVNGTELIQSINEYELNPNVPSHVLLTALTIHYQIMHSTSNYRNRTLPYSVRGLEAPLELFGERNGILLGELPGTRPELMSSRLAELGLVSERKPNAAGVWVPESFEQVFKLVAKNWTRQKGISRP